MSDAGDHDRPKEFDSVSGKHAERQDDALLPHVVRSAALLEGRSQLAILHNETVYFLRQTRFGKLILTK